MICHQINLIVFIWELANLSGIVSERTCNLNKLFVCLEGESCKQVKNSSAVGVCECRSNFKRLTPNGVCIEQLDSNHPSLPNPESVYSSGATVSAIVGGLVIALLFVTLIAGLVFATKKYRWIPRVREKAQQFRARHYDTVLVTQEDDPPLA
ncbi:hypothetical protein RUM44_006259 [Polyplax serrata]|uniref:EB domain-containing protein n=1 Tax=Polyplax serrata TaxID=468196 RepID=A0ABR1AHL4_POLSC